MAIYVQTPSTVLICHPFALTLRVEISVDALADSDKRPSRTSRKLAVELVSLSIQFYGDGFLSLCKMIIGIQLEPNNPDTTNDLFMAVNLDFLTSLSLLIAS